MLLARAIVFREASYRLGADITSTSMHVALFGPALLGAALLLQPQIALPPAPRGYAPNAADVVVDAAGVLRPESIERINRLAFDVKQKSGGEMAIVTLPDLAGRTPEEVALAIGRTWGIGAEGTIGDRARNAGIVILVVPKETSRDGRGYIRIETGRGAEGFINDARAGEMRDEALPALRAGDYSAAVELIALRVAERFAAEFGFTLDSTFAPPVQPAREPGRRAFPVGGLVMLVLFLVVMGIYSRRHGGGPVLPTPMYRRRGRRNDWWGGGGGFGGFGGGGGWSSGGGGGGFGGFGGGGGFSGGGAGGSW
ncbi:MAG: TPM domain-containing protein [Gemmatimonadaceae bacterium]